MSIAVVVMAAGLSSRMGRCKALLPWRDKTVLDAVLAAFVTTAGEKILVAGHDWRAMTAIADRYGFRVVVNTCPEEGQASSLRQGIKALTGQEDGVLCAVADQPLLQAKYIRRMVDAFGKWRAEDERVIVCPQYGESKGGNPVIFGAYWRRDLLALTGDIGGRAVLRGVGKEHIVYCRLPAEVGRDLDTPEEYALMYRLWGKL